MSGHDAFITRANVPELQELGAIMLLDGVMYDEKEAHIFAKMKNRLELHDVLSERLPLSANIVTKSNIHSNNVYVTFPRTPQSVSGMSILCITEQNDIKRYETSLTVPTGEVKHLQHVGDSSLLPQFNTLPELVDEILRVYHELHRPEYNRKKRQRIKACKLRWLVAHSKRAK